MLSLLNARRHCLFALLLCSLSLGCATNPRARLWQADQTIATTLFALQDAEMAFARVQAVPSWITPDRPDGTSPHNRFNQHLASALKIGRSFHQVVQDWPADGAKQDLLALVQSLGDMSREITAALPPGPNRDRLQATLAAVQAAVLAALPFLVE